MRLSLKPSLFAELKRRNVLRAGAFYIAAIWALAQGISQLGPAIGLPDWTTRWFLVAAIIGFPFWIAFAWFYEFTPEGLKRESEVEPHESITHHTGRKLDFAIISVLAVAVVLLLTNTFVWHKGSGLQASADETPIPDKSLAVLPFINLSDEKSQEYFADGISEELLNLLAKAQPLQVAARTSSFSFKGKQLGIPEIAKALHVANVLEGSVRKAGDAVRITAQLIRAADGYEIWSQSWDKKLDDIFAIQDSIAADVVAQLKVKLLGAVPTARQTDPKAYALYLQARELARQNTADAYQQADALNRQALAIDPRYAPAWFGLSVNSVNKTTIGAVPNDEGLRQAKEAAEKALAIDPDFALAEGWLGYIANDEGDLSRAAGHFERALSLEPSDLRILANSIALLESLGRLKEALAIREYVVARDPVNVTRLNNLGDTYVFAGRYDEAIAKYRTVLTLSPGRGQTHAALGGALLLKGDAKAALAQMQQETSEVVRLTGLATTYDALGQRAESDAALGQLIYKYEKDESYSIAEAYAWRGEADEAFAWLDKAVQYADPGLSLIVVDNLFDKIHNDPRWIPFLHKLGKAPEQLAKIEFKVTLPQAEGATASSVPHP